MLLEQPHAQSPRGARPVTLDGKERPMLISFWWAVGAFFAGCTAGMFTLALLASPVRNGNPVEHAEYTPRG